MGVFDPDDFSGRPYVGGMNQALHHVFGRAIIGQATYWFSMPVFWAVLISGIGYVIWEGWQLKFRGASMPDYWADLVYWMSGTAVGALIYLYGLQQDLFWSVPLVIWFIEYKRLSLRRAFRW